MRYDLRCAGCQGAFTGLKNQNFPYCTARCRNYWESFLDFVVLCEQSDADDRRIAEDGHA